MSFTGSITNEWPEQLLARHLDKDNHRVRKAQIILDEARLGRRPILMGIWQAPIDPSSAKGQTYLAKCETAYRDAKALRDATLELIDENPSNSDPSFS